MNKKITLLSIAITLLTALIMQPIAQTNALSITNLSQTQGPTSGGNSITLHGTDFILDEDDAIAQFVTKAHHSLVLTESGRVFAWGLNDYGQLGLGDNTNRNLPQDITNQFNGEIVIQVAVGDYHSFALTKSGKIYGWGRNDWNQVGTGDAVSSYSSPQDITANFNGEQVIKIYNGGYHTLGLTKSGKIFIWGSNQYGQLGVSNTNSYNLPQDITITFGQNNINQVVAGDNSTIVLTNNGKVYSWGANTYGQLGVGGTSHQSSPQDITTQFSGEEIAEVNVGFNHSFALTKTNKVFAWGRNNQGQLGNGATLDIDVPTDVTSQFGAETVEQIAGGGNFTFATTSSGKIFAWGHNWYGQLANGANVDLHVPQDVTANFNGEEIAQFSVGYYHGSVLTKLGKILTWGWGSYGQLGNGGNSAINLPQDITTNFNLGAYPVVQVTSVYFGPSEVEQFQVLDANTISLIVPSHQAGFVDIMVNDINSRTTTLSNGYEYITIGVPNTGVEYE